MTEPKKENPYTEDPTWSDPQCVCKRHTESSGTVHEVVVECPIHGHQWRMPSDLGHRLRVMAADLDNAGDTMRLAVDAAEYGAHKLILRRLHADLKQLLSRVSEVLV